MKFITVKSYEELSFKGATMIAAQMIQKPDCVLGLATGSSPEGIYENLVKWYKDGILDFSQVTSVNLDEYVGLNGDHPQSYRYFMQDKLFNHVNICREKTFVPNGCAADYAKECAAYDQMIADMDGIDLQLLGIGLDGHIGFNEPGDHFDGATHVVDLHASTIEANSRFFDSADEVPKQAVTMGMMSIMRSKKILLVANGAAKKDILLRACNGPITPEIPASLLQLHPDVTVIFSEN